MDHGASQAEARLLFLQTEDHAFAAKDRLREKATKPRAGGDSGQVGPGARPGINERCTGPSVAAQGYGGEVAAAQYDPWWRLPRSHLVPEAGVAGPEALPARHRPASRHVPAAASRMRARPLAPITESRGSARFTRAPGRPAQRAPRPRRASGLASCSRAPGGHSVLRSPRPAEPVRPG